jgi:photosystem II stability/assembly factor-like uncharacterized protein
MLNRIKPITLRSALARRRIVIAGGLVALLVAAAIGTSASIRSKSSTSTPVAKVAVAPEVLTAHVRDAVRVTESFGWRLTSEALEVTRDSGSTWSRVTPSNVQSELIRAVAFNPSLHGWVLTSARTGANSSELLVYRTSDGGQSWLSAQVAAPSADFAEAPNGQAAIDFLDSRHGWIEVSLATGSAFSAGDLFRTDDGGVTWSQAKSPAAGVIAFATPSNGWLAGGVGQGQLFATQDGGQTWSATVPPLPAGTSAANVTYTLTERAGGVGLAADIAGSPGATLLFNLTGQNTWHLVQRFRDDSIVEPGAASPVAFAGPAALATAINQGREIVVAPVGSGAETTVKSNLPITANANVSSLSFVTPRDGWAIVSGTACARVKTDCTSYSALYATSDAGASWTQLRG